MKIIIIKRAVAFILVAVSLTACNANINNVKNFNIESLKKDCENGDGLRCAKVGHYYELGHETKKDYTKATEYYEKSCKLNYGIGCFLSSYMYQEGKGVTRNLTKSKQYLASACALGEKEACKMHYKINK